MDELLDSDLIAAAEDGSALLAFVGLSRVVGPRSLRLSAGDVRRAGGLAVSVARRMSAFLEARSFAKTDFSTPDFATVRDMVLGFEERLPVALAAIAAADLQANVGASVTACMTLLRSRMPKVPNRPDARPSDFASASFLRAWRTLDNPMTVVDDLDAGCLCRDQIDVLKSCLPAVYELLANAAMAAVVDRVAREPSFVVPYPRLKQLAVLLQQPLVPPDLRTLLEQTFSAPETQQEQSSGSPATDLGAQSLTALQKREFA